MDSVLCNPTYLGSASRFYLVKVHTFDDRQNGEIAVRCCTIFIILICIIRDKKYMEENITLNPNYSLAFIESKCFRVVPQSVFLIIGYGVRIEHPLCSVC